MRKRSLSPTDFICDRPEQHRVDFGDRQIVGPSPLNQDRTCVDGQTCRVTDLLGHLGSGDRLHAVDGVRFVQLPGCPRTDRGLRLQTGGVSTASRPEGPHQ